MEVSFSKYKHMLDERRYGMKETPTKHHTMLYCNGDIVELNYDLYNSQVAEEDEGDADLL